MLSAVAGDGTDAVSHSDGDCLFLKAALHTCCGLLRINRCVAFFEEMMDVRETAGKRDIAANLRLSSAGWRRGKELVRTQ